MLAFQKLIGQQHLRMILTRGRERAQLAHAYLLHGEEGLGMSCAAVEFARMMLCESEGEAPCGSCPSCRKSQRLDHPDLRILMPLPTPPSSGDEEDPAAHFATQVNAELARLAEDPWHRVSIPGARQILVSQARHLKRWASLRSFEGRGRVAILLEAERMGAQAQNALLKLLEEPPDGLLLLLCTSAPEALLPTILSRCQQLRLQPVDEQELIAALSLRQPEATAESLQQIARQAGGNPGRALALLQEDALDEELDAAAFLRDTLRADSGPLYQRIATLEARKDRLAVRELIRDLQAWLQDVELIQTCPGRESELVRNLHQLDALVRFAERFEIRNLDELAAELSRLAYLAERNLHLFILLTQLAIRLKSAIQARRVKA